MKLVKKLPLLLLMAAPYFMPINSWADNNKNKDKDKNKDKQKDYPISTAATSNSVPLDEGVVFLVVAGLALGARLLYDARAKKKVAREL